LNIKVKTDEQESYRTEPSKKVDDKTPKRKQGISARLPQSGKSTKDLKKHYASYDVPDDEGENLDESNEVIDTELSGRRKTH
jgi:hypothetical protein